MGSCFMHKEGFFLTPYSLSASSRFLNSTSYHLVHYYYIQQIHGACDDQQGIISSFITTFWDSSQSTRYFSCLLKVCKSR